MDIREIFAANLRRLRHEKDYSQEELADVADINRTYTSKLETAAAYAGLEIINRLARALGTEPFELLKPLPKRLKYRR
jgi:transcriptional regulator with XRE-family HTH domain